MESTVPMSRRPALAFVLVAATLVAPTLVRVAAADEPSKQQCVSANESAQSLRRAGKLRDARAQLLQCVNPACPGPVRDDCSERLNEVEKALPTIVFTAKDAGGTDLTSVHVTSDGAPLADALSATAVAVDPGEHLFAFEADGYVRMEKNVVIREGDKGRRISVVLQPVTRAEPPATASPVAPTPSPPTPKAAQSSPPDGDARTGSEAPPATSTSTPVAAYVALGVGGVGVVVTTVFGVLALGNKSSLDSACGSDKKACPASSRSDINGMHTNSIISDVGLGVGIVGLGVGGALLLFGRGGPDGPQEKTGVIHVEPWVGVGALGMRGKF